MEYTVPSSGRISLNLNRAWRFIQDDGEGFHRVDLCEEQWPAVEVPHTWNLQDAFTGKGCHLHGPFWYRRHVAISREYAGRQVYLQFDAVNRECEIYVNGAHAGDHTGGYSIFRVDITPYITPGEDNVIAVKVTNRYDEDLAPIFADSTSFGGIIKDVHLLVTDKLHVDVMDYGSPGVYLTQHKVDAASADIHLAARVRNDHSAAKEVAVRAILVDANHHIISVLNGTVSVPTKETRTFKKVFTVEAPRLWNGKADPYLYHTYVEILDGGRCTDVLCQPLGIRHFHIDCDEGFFLNGEPYDLHGVSRSYDRPEKGRAIGYAEQAEDMALILEMGCTAVRAPLYDNAEAFYDLCDQHGILLSVEIPVTNRVGLL